MNKSLAIIGGLAIIGILAFLIFLSPKQDHSNMNTMSTAQVPDFVLENYEGAIVKQTDFASKPLVINSWAAWCPFCRKELADFAVIKKEFGDKVVIIAIDRAETKEVAKKYTDELGVTADMIFLLDPSDSFYQSIGGFSMPETIFVDKEGNIKIHKRGPMDINEMRQKINEIL